MLAKEEPRELPAESTTYVRDTTHGASVGQSATLPPRFFRRRAIIRSEREIRGRHPQEMPKQRCLLAIPNVRAVLFPFIALLNNVCLSFHITIFPSLMSNALHNKGCRKYFYGIRWSWCRDSVWYWAFSTTNHLDTHGFVKWESRFVFKDLKYRLLNMDATGHFNLYISRDIVDVVDVNFKSLWF